MAISREDIEHIAKLARLDVDGAAFERLAADMQGIVGMVDQLQKLDLGDITDSIDTEKKTRCARMWFVPLTRGKSCCKTRPRWRPTVSACPRLWNRRREGWNCIRKRRPSFPR